MQDSSFIRSSGIEALLHDLNNQTESYGGKHSNRPPVVQSKDLQPSRCLMTSSITAIAKETKAISWSIRVSQPVSQGVFLRRNPSQHAFHNFLSLQCDSRLVLHIGLSRHTSLFLIGPHLFSVTWVSILWLIVHLLSLLTKYHSQLCLLSLMFLIMSVTPLFLDLVYTLFVLKDDFYHDFLNLPCNPFLVWCC